MKRTKSIAVLSVALASCVFVASCARLPAQSTAKNTTKSFFKKYGKKYPETIYGKNKVTDVDVTSTSEVHKGLAAVEMFITLSDGSVQRIHATFLKKPTGWKLVSWENAT